MLTVSIKCDDVFPFFRLTIPTNILKSSLECCASSSIHRMTYCMDLLRKMRFEQSRSIISRSIVDDENLTESRSQDAREYLDYSGRFIVASHEKDDFTIFYFHGRCVRVLSHV